MRALIIGGSRYMGYGLVWRLLAGGHEVALFNRGQTADPFGSRVQRFRGDRTTSDLPRLLSGQRFDAAVDFAAYHGRDVAEAVETLGLAGVGHYVLISTGQVYLVRQGCPSPAREDDYHGPLMPAPVADRAEWEYGMGKRAGEDVLFEAWRASGFPGTALRLPIVNGERDPTRRLESYLWRLLDGGPVLLPDGGGSRLRHVYASDVVRALAGMLGQQGTFGRAYNVCQEEAPSLRELLELLAEVMGGSGPLVSVPAARIEEAGLAVRGVSPFSSRWVSHLDPARARAELGFVATPLRQALESIVASFLARLPDSSPPESYAQREREARLAREAS